MTFKSTSRQVQNLDFFPPFSFLAFYVDALLDLFVCYALDRVIGVVDT
jgi:hypothetical protein